MATIPALLTLRLLLKQGRVKSVGRDGVNNLLEILGIEVIMQLHR